MSGEKKHYTPHDDLVNLGIDMQNLQTATEALNASIDELSSKAITPLNIADVVTGSSLKFGLLMYDTTLDWTGGNVQYPICYDGTKYFYGIEIGLVHRIELGGAKTVIIDSELTMVSITYDRENDYIILGERADDDDPLGGHIETYDLDANLIHSVRARYADTTPEVNIKAVGYYNDANLIYLV